MFGLALLALLALSVPRSHALSEAHRGATRLAPGLELLEIELGQVRLDQHTGRRHFVPTDRVEMIPGQGYGWRARVRTGRSAVTWREELFLPQAPARWGINEAVTLSHDRRRAITTMKTAPDHEGVLYNYWIFAEGDPPGDYRIRVDIEDVPVLSGRLRVE